MSFVWRTRVGDLTIEPLDVAANITRLHIWISHPRSVFWCMPGVDEDAVRRQYELIHADPHYHAWLGRLDGEPIFLTETYEPGHSELGAHYPVRDGDVGMHLLVAPPVEAEPPRHGLTSAIMRTILEFIFADERHLRTVVDPDVHNRKILAKNAEAGFVVDRLVRLTDRVAWLSFCSRADFAASSLVSAPSGRENR